MAALISLTFDLLILATAVGNLIKGKGRNTKQNPQNTTGIVSLPVPKFSYRIPYYTVRTIVLRNSFEFDVTV